MRTKIILQKLTTKFENLLQQKTNWGRNDVKAIFHDAKQQVLMDLLDEMENDKE